MSLQSQTTAMLGLLAETSIHAGSGQMLGSVDLPIQREMHTQWPCVFGSGVKGALRARATELMGRSEDLEAIFGPDVKAQKASEHAGALAVGDARLLLLPIRSLTGPFRWVTCPAVLARWRRDLRRLAVGAVDGRALDLELAAVDAAVADDTVVLATEPRELAGTPFFLEELRFEPRVVALDTLVATLARLLVPLPAGDDAAAEDPSGEDPPGEDAVGENPSGEDPPGEDPSGDDPSGQDAALRVARSTVQRLLCIVDDTVFGDLARFGVPVNPHVTIDNETGTVADTALWSEESLPPETVLYVPLHASRSRRPGDRLESHEILGRLLDGLRLHPYLQLGGNETVGMGWCQLGVLQSAARGGAS